ncbi:hypothetical protein [Kitasatospora azatica]|uniref:hypothetical protein n=1 Tax=Kitasatospora azatica TaxID=58347 RepID=UPI0005623B05|nr:hypothetical protein [Kitasatospora azatica]
MTTADDRDDEVLEHEVLTEALGALAGPGSRGARFAARFLHKDVREVELRLPLPFEHALALVGALLDREGPELHPRRPEPDPDRRTFRVLTRGGVGGMNPVLVTVRAVRGGSDATEVRLRCAAFEGLFKQRSAQKAVDRLAGLLTA